MTQENSKTSRMATAPVNKLMLSIGMPIVVSMMLQAVYNIVDSAFLSNMAEAGEEALTALGLAFPIQLLMIAVGVGTGVGTNALLSKSLGQGNREKASYTAGNAIFMGAVIYVFFLIFAFVGVPMYVRSQSAGGNISETVLLMAIDYLKICCGISFGIVFFSIYEKILQSMGRSMFSTIAQITGAVINIVMDPILIYGLLGFPEMGVKGAAWATVIGQIASAVLVFIFHTKLDKEVDKSVKYMRPKGKILVEIYKIGLPAVISQALLTVMTYGLNIVLGNMKEIGENAVTVYGLYCKIQQLIIFAAVGMRDAITPIVSFNHGMRSSERVKQGMKYGVIYTAILMAIGLAVMELVAGPLAVLFNLSDVTYTMCVQCIRIISLGFILAGISIAFQGIFQALECGIESLVISANRQVVFIIPIAWVLSKFVTGAENSWIVWWTFMIGEGLTMLITIIMFRRKKVQDKINM